MLTTYAPRDRQTLSAPNATSSARVAGLWPTGASGRAEASSRVSSASRAGRSSFSYSSVTPPTFISSATAAACARDSSRRSSATRSSPNTCARSSSGRTSVLAASGQPDPVEPADDRLDVRQKIARLAVGRRRRAAPVQRAQLLADAEAERAEGLALQRRRDGDPGQQVLDLEAQGGRQPDLLVRHGQVADQPFQLGAVKRDGLAAREVLRPPGHVGQHVRVAVAIAADPAAEDDRRGQRRADAVLRLDRAFHLLDQARDHGPQHGRQVHEPAARLVFHRRPRAVQLGRAPQKGDARQQRAAGRGLVAARASVGRGRHAIQVGRDLGQVVADRAAARLRRVRGEGQVQAQRSEERDRLLGRPPVLLQRRDQGRDRLRARRVQAGASRGWRSRACGAALQRCSPGAGRRRRREPAPRRRPATAPR